MINRKFFCSLLWSLSFLVLSLIINFYAAAYATLEASQPVTDIILSNTSVWNVDLFFIYGPVIFWIFVVYLFIKYPQYINFSLKSISVFIITRSIFISLTHLAPFPTRALIEPSSLLTSMMGGKLIFTFFMSEGLFFSGHTGLPFLMALVFWDKKTLRYIFIAASVFFGAVVLLGHLHYTIDVFGAYFITDGIYRISELIFKKDHARINVQTANTLLS